EEADGGAGPQLLAGHSAGHDDGVGDEEPSARTEDTVPVAQDGGAAGEVVERIVAEERVERCVGKRQRRGGVGLLGPGAGGRTRGGGEGGGGGGAGRGGGGGGVGAWGAWGLRSPRTQGGPVSWARGRVMPPEPQATSRAVRPEAASWPAAPPGLAAASRAGG